MNEVYFSYNPFLKQSMILIDDKQISPFSTINNYLFDRFDYFCMSLIKEIYNDINGGFLLKLSAGKFETLIIESIVREYYSDIVGFESLPYANGLSINDRIDLLKKFGAIHTGHQISPVHIFFDDGVNIEEIANNILKTDSFSFDAGRKAFVYSRYSQLTDVALTVRTNISGSNFLEIGFFSDSGKAVEFLKNADTDFPRVGVVIGEKSSAQVLQGKYLLKMSSEQFADILPEMLDFFVIDEIISGLSAQAAAWTDSCEVKLISAVEPIVEISFPDVISYGTHTEPTVKVLPYGCNTPELVIESSDVTVAKAVGSSVYALSGGNTVISFYVKGSNTPALRKNVSVFRELRIQTITLSPKKMFLEVGSGDSLSATVTPQNADNISNLRWSSDNPSVATVDEKGNVTTHSPGTCHICLSAGDVSDFCEVTSAPKIERIDITLSHNSGDDIVNPSYNICSVIGQKFSVCAKAYPENAYDTSLRYVIRQNERFPQIEYKNNIITTTGIGSATIEFISDSGNIRRPVNINVISTLNPPKNICKTIAVILIIISAIMSVTEPGMGIVASCLAILFGVLGLGIAKKNKTNWDLIIGNTKKYPIANNFIVLVLAAAVLIYNIILALS